MSTVWSIAEINAITSVHYKHAKFCNLFSVCVYDVYVPSKILIHFATFCWLHIHGFPPVIYLAFNPTIQKDAKQMWFSVLRRCKGQTKDKEIVTTTTARIERSNTNSAM
uniref:Uncharacterized protein n=1 Tax=Ditylenchus dipsaci TaxID=166011 RepID=A0A915D191_9BILA